MNAKFMVIAVLLVLVQTICFVNSAVVFTPQTTTKRVFTPQTTTKGVFTPQTTTKGTFTPQTTTRSSSG